MRGGGRRGGGGKVYLPEVGLVNLPHRESVKSVTSLNHRLDLITAGHILIDLITHIHGRSE